jgi:hypothetical protein
MKGAGQEFDDFMIEQGLYDETKGLAAKKLIAYAKSLFGILPSSASLEEIKTERRKRYENNR